LIKKESHERSPGLQTRSGLRGFIAQQKRGFPLMAALVLVLVVAIVVRVLVAMHHGFMAVPMAVVGMGACLMAVLVLMFVFAVATHLGSPPGHLI
jgi:protein-S-isoprenylcysteine O-methyltransferase Ste14